MNVGYDNILTSTLHVVKLREVIAVAAADTCYASALQLSRVGSPRGKLDAFVYYKKTTTRLRNNFAYMDDSLQLA